MAVWHLGQAGCEPAESAQQKSFLAALSESDLARQRRAEVRLKAVVRRAANSSQVMQMVRKIEMEKLNLNHVASLK